MKLVFTDHLKFRLKERGVSAKVVKKIFDNSEEFYWDNLRSHHIVINTIMYKRRRRKMLAAYDTIGDGMEIVTVHPISEKDIRQRVISKRWSYERNEN